MTGPLSWMLRPSPSRPKIKYSNLTDENRNKKSKTTTTITNSFSAPSAETAQHREDNAEWIRGVQIRTWIAGAVLVLNVILAIIGTSIGYSRTSFPGNPPRLISAQVYKGKCSVAEHSVTGLHLLINVLSTVLLGASSYVLQYIVAPSRADVDRAHRGRKWLSIGVFSLRNFSIMDYRRKILWFLLLLTSIPIHVIYNSVIYRSPSSLEYGIVLIPENLQADEPLVNGESATDSFLARIGSSPITIQKEIFDGTFQNMTVEKCIDKYSTNPNLDQGTMVLAADKKYFHNTTSLFGQVFTDDQENYEGLDGYMADGVTGLHWSYRQWNFTAPDPTTALEKMHFTFNSTFNKVHVTNDPHKINEDIATLFSYCLVYNPKADALRQYLDNSAHWHNSSWARNVSFELGGEGPIVYSQSGWAGHEWDQTSVKPSYCMAKSEEERCQLFFSPLISLVVIICNVAKVACMYLAARIRRKELLLTVGDAVSSFLTRPDETTKGRCLMARSDMTRGPQRWTPKSQKKVSHYLGFERYRRHKGKEQSDLPLNTLSSMENESYLAMLPARKRWCRAASWKQWTLVLLWCFICVGGCICTTFMMPPSGGDHEYDGYPMLENGDQAIYIIVYMLLTNAPQLFFTVLYFLCNGLLTCMLLAAEWSHYGIQQKPLRVSWPKGEQRPTHFLSLPWRYSGPMLVVSVSMHWLLSQTFFFTTNNYITVNDEVDLVHSYYNADYNGYYMLALAAVGVVAFLALFGLSARKLYSQMPLATHCSAAISAACHPPADDSDAALKAIMWGELQDEEEDDDDAVSRDGSSTSVDESPQRGHRHCTFTSKRVFVPRKSIFYA